MESVKIVGFAMLAAIVYGILHDQVTAHLCVEYFTLAHPAIFPTQSPFWLAIGWGVLATWWVGLVLGIGLAVAARLGGAPKLRLAELRLPILKLMAITALAALLSGMIGYWLSGVMTRPADFPFGDYRAFTAVAFAHQTSYGLGGLAGLFLIGWTIWRRRKAPA